ncbi:hypothetical protein F884_01848 [Acinetobacter sp. CIP 102143]|uniref:DUF4365 domain-containing protein n=1 Tax=Acinetobacter TaxID=469 RepID=UPI0002CE1375|nr:MULTISPECIES: DUF4365 domain-containing protein [unclassified Acinetobacter]ENU89676.1 hypothetical protein F972_01130 [Acinetobacter sp. CIP 102529]ENX64173.1 hypothetical protein F884_01848 [Acinetobacter sp. CIP 102143]
MSIDKRILDNLGVTSVTNFVETQILCGWQGYDAKNDNAFDGMIIMRRGSSSAKETGGILFVQIKCGTTGGYKVVRQRDPENIGIQVGEVYIRNHRERWNIVPSPSILIFVDADNYDVRQPHKYEPIMYWVDLKKDESYCATNKQLILVPKKNKISLKTKGEFHELCRGYLGNATLEDIFINSSEGLPVHLGSKISLKSSAWDFYKNWRNQGIYNHQKLGKIYINGMGWRHITRAGRGNQRIVASWLLLPVARKIIEITQDFKVLDRIDIKQRSDLNRVLIRDYIALRAKVSFNYRDSSIVQVILKRERLYDVNNGLVNQNLWFYSVFELRRGRVQ